MQDVALRGSFDAGQARRYVHVPFEVPPGVRSVHVAYDYSARIASDPQLIGGNTLDIGIFDSRGIAPSSPGFRGWSGSHKLEFTIAENWATPPYLAGPTQPGTWHVLLGPYKVGPRGCDYEVTISFSQDPGLPEVRPLRIDAPPARRGPAAENGWLRGDLHCHTLYSDGDSWPVDMLADAVGRGLDFLGVTDHNQTGHQREYARVEGAHLPILLPGIEVTTYGGHWNAWGTDTWWEFREPTEAATTRAMQAAVARGALVSVNHPKPFGPAWEYPMAVGYHAIEVWNGDWQRQNDVSLTWWEQLLRAGRRIVIVGGSDTHNLKETDADTRHGRHLGRPTTWADAAYDPSTAGVLAALRAGRAFISRDVDGPQLYFTRHAEGFRIRVVGGRQADLRLRSERGVETTLNVVSSDWSDIIRQPQGVNYVRAELVDHHGEMLALTNAVFVTDPASVGC
jgi:hypothetical protein